MQNQLLSIQQTTKFPVNCVCLKPNKNILVASLVVLNTSWLHIKLQCFNFKQMCLLLLEIYKYHLVSDISRLKGTCFITNTSFSQLSCHMHWCY